MVGLELGSVLDRMRLGQDGIGIRVGIGQDGVGSRWDWKGGVG